MTLNLSSHSSPTPLLTSSPTPSPSPSPSPSPTPSPSPSPSPSPTPSSGGKKELSFIDFQKSTKSGFSQYHQGPKQQAGAKNAKIISAFRGGKRTKKKQFYMKKGGKGNANLASCSAMVEGQHERSTVPQTGGQDHFYSANKTAGKIQHALGNARQLNTGGSVLCPSPPVPTPALLPQSGGRKKRKSRKRKSRKRKSRKRKSRKRKSRKRKSRKRRKTKKFRRRKFH